MKPWMKVLVWLFLGSGAGFFAGYQVGKRDNGRMPVNRSNLRSERFEESDEEEYEEQAAEAMRAYSGASEGISEEETCSGEDSCDINPVDMGEEQLQKELAIEELHPQDILPRRISQEEYSENNQDYEYKYYRYFERDEILYDPESKEIITFPEQRLGHGWWMHFRGKPGEPARVIFFANDTEGTLYQVELVESSFYDEVPGTVPPDDGVGEEDEEDDTW